ncbi:MAG: LysM peptidoglycan-binding domain-containing protein [Chloroflexi bacterium]|nr:LysM peptidoglycan-binding domain-containing protein [Chloroflexota bacterium]
MIITRRNLLLLSFFILLSGIFFPKGVLARDPQPATDAYTLIAEVNALRANNGLPPYAINATLMAIAQAHSDYQAATGTVTHYSADGSRPYQRALAAGYPVGGNLAARGYFSENIQAGTNLSPAAAVQAWQGDAPHLNTMLSPHLTEVGAGVTNVNGYIYYTLDASTPSGGTVPAYTPNPEETPNGTEVGVLPTLDLIMPVIISTPNGEGKVVHEVQVGQSLWGVADVYGTTVQEIRALNNMSVDELVYPGELLLIRTVATQIPLTPTFAPTNTGLPTTPFLTEATFPTSEPTVIPVESPTEIPSEKVVVDSSMWTVLVIVFVALLMAGIVTWLSGRDS